MQVLHGVWRFDVKNENKFYIWAKSSISSTTQKSRNIKNSQVHPFAVSKNKLKTLLRSFSEEDLNIDEEKNSSTSVSKL